jgi:signal transduction histidine kinase
MSLPPPIRVTAPLLALVFGLVTTWFDYRLNLDLDLNRLLAELRDSADANGKRLAQLGSELLASEKTDALQSDIEAMSSLPHLEAAAITDPTGKIIVSSDPTMRGLNVYKTSLAGTAGHMEKTSPAIWDSEDTGTVDCVRDFRIDSANIGWVLLRFDRTAAIAAAKADALIQLRWMACAMALLSFALWAVLHFGFAARLGRLADAVRALGEGKSDAPAPPTGTDEVGRLGGAFTTMAAQLRERDERQVQLEREVLETSERERRRIGQDLHDNLGQRLTAASMATNALVTSLEAADPALAARGSEIGRQLRETIAEARALSHGLAPVALADDGLLVALRSLAETTSHGGAVRCVVECLHPVSALNAETAGHLYRMAQEAVTNAVKHANPSEIRIGLERRDGTLLLEIDDDGDGFDEFTATSGIGLRVMRHRAQLIGGTLEVGSAPAGGARISCRVKLPT